ncbi:alpha-amylase family glycosyl hydrolase [Alkalilimnicola ehrlichii]|uniref:alpha-amylase family glycosyl hydrolase n=1 Tax=Alkalilimnicola ehrlichii TaxID=351052 RepID=UPI00384C6D8E
MRALMERYPGTFTMGEVGDDNSLDVMAAYTSGGDKLQMAYSFDLLTEQGSASYIRSTVERLESRIGDGWPCWSMGNHDVARVVTRWGGENPHPRMASVFAAMLLSLRGSACLYQGDELGLTEAEIPFEQLQDPYGIRFWPRWKGRDGCRTPMPWQHDLPQAGFTTGTPWLPIPEEHRAMAVDVQEKDPDSVLASYRQFLQWRRQQPALCVGDIVFFDAPENVLLFKRSAPEQQILVAINLSGQTVDMPLNVEEVDVLSGHGFGGHLEQGRLVLPAWDAWYGDVSRAESVLLDTEGATGPTAVE